MSTILLVEDNVNNQLLIEDLFEFEEVGAHLAVFGNAEEALKSILRSRPILVLMDIGLPGMSGLEATRILKSDPRTADIPVWALTAHALEQSQVEAAEAGCDQYVTKPIDSDALAQRLRDFVRANTPREAA